MKFEIKILKRKHIYITVTDTTRTPLRCCVKYKPEQKIPTSAAIASIVSQLVRRRIDKEDK